MRRVRVLGLTVTALALVASCTSGHGVSKPDALPPPAAATVPPISPPAPAVKRLIPEPLRFTAKTIDGGDFSGESLPAKPVVLWFWAPWCPVCNRVAPEVSRIATANAGNVTFIGVSGEDRLSAMKDFVGKYKLDKFPQLADLDGSLFRRFGIYAKPTFVFIDSDGTTKKELGALPEERLTELVRGLGKTAPRTEEVAPATSAQPRPA